MHRSYLVCFPYGVFYKIINIVFVLLRSYTDFGDHLLLSM